jgi:hemoglobin
VLVDTFYERVRKDELLAPIFNERIKDWGPHLETMYQFWQTLLLDQHTYRGAPFAKHLDLQIDNRHFDRWITLFHQTVDENFSGMVADEAKFRAIKIAEVFRYKLDLLRF